MDAEQVANKRHRVLPWNSLTLNLDRATIHAGSVVVQASPAEFKLMHLLLTHRSVPLSREVAMTSIFGPDHGRDDRQADFLVARLRRLLTPYGLGEAIGTVAGRGYMLVDGLGSSSPRLDRPALASV